MGFNASNKAFDEAFSKKKKKSKRWEKNKQKFILRNQIYDRLTEMFEKGQGRSRHEDKLSEEDLTKDKIYSVTTYKTYRAQCYRFADYLRKNYSDIKRIQQVKIEHVNDYLQSMIDQDLSAYTISTAKASIAKVLNLSSTEFMKTPPRLRKDIKRSRRKAVRDKHISKEKEAYFAKITSSLGLRSCELTRARGTDLFKKNGKYYIKVRNAKGGKVRTAEVCCEDEAELNEIIELFKGAGQLKVAPKLPSHFDNHHYRAMYARRLYNRYARPLEEIPGGAIKDGGERYAMRKDMKGQILDRKAMLLVSENLGHSRIDVIAQSYLYN